PPLRGRVGAGAPGPEEQAGGALVEAVDDPGPVGLADAGDLRVAGEQAVDQRPLVPPGTRVDDDAGRLVDDDQVVVLVDDGHGHGGGGLGSRLLRGVGDGDVEGLALGHPVGARGDRPPVDQHGTAVDQLGRLRATATGDEGDDPVESLAVERAGDDLPQGGGRHRSASSPDPATGPPGSGSAPRSAAAGTGSPASRHCAPKSSTAPTTMAESARLNTGHHCRSTKSTTPPPRNPSPSRTARSRRLPSAPPRIMPSATATTG